MKESTNNEDGAPASHKSYRVLDYFDFVKSIMDSSAVTSTLELK